MDSVTIPRGAAGIALSLLLLVGCATRQGATQQVRVYPPPPPGPPPPDYVEKQFPVEDGYVYYPAYQVYYNKFRREYVFLEHGEWVSRSKPPRRMKGKALDSSPSVKLDFRDSPSLHHAEVVEQYPKNWMPDGDAKENRDDEKNGKGHR
jgi:hypothetical protein